MNGVILFKSKEQYNLKKYKDFYVIPLSIDLEFNDYLNELEKFYEDKTVHSIYEVTSNDIESIVSKILLIGFKKKKYKGLEYMEKITDFLIEHYDIDYFRTTLVNMLTRKTVYYCSDTKQLMIVIPVYTVSNTISFIEPIKENCTVDFTKLVSTSVMMPLVFVNEFLVSKNTVNINDTTIGYMVVGNMKDNKSDLYVSIIESRFGSNKVISTKKIPLRDINITVSKTDDGDVQISINEDRKRIKDLSILKRFVESFDPEKSISTPINYVILEKSDLEKIEKDDGEELVELSIDLMNRIIIFHFNDKVVFNTFSDKEFEKLYGNYDSYKYIKYYFEFEPTKNINLVNVRSN